MNIGIAALLAEYGGALDGLIADRVQFAEQLAGQRHCVTHDLLQPESNPIPFDHREFGLMRSTSLALPKRLADRIYVGIAGGEQTLHKRFR